MQLLGDVEGVVNLKPLDLSFKPNNMFQMKMLLVFFLQMDRFLRLHPAITIFPLRIWHLSPHP